MKASKPNIKRGPKGRPTIEGIQVSSVGSKIIVKDNSTGQLHKLDRMSLIKTIDRKNNLNLYEL